MQNFVAVAQKTMAMPFRGCLRLVLVEGGMAGIFWKRNRDCCPGGKVPERMWELLADLVKIFHAGIFLFSVWW